jgi:predicted NBD/HSP70 family sugar kinase
MGSAGTRVGQQGRMRKPAYSRQLVCATLFHEGAMSRAGLSQRTGVPAPRLSSACGELLCSGLIRETTVAPAHGNGRGRPQTLLEVDLRGLAVAGVQYDNEHVTAALMDLAGAVRWQRRWDTGPDEPANRRLRRIVRATREAIASGPKIRVRVVGVGVADPGTVNLAAGRAVRAVNVPGWENVPVLDAVRDATGLPAVLHRGDGWAALGEVVFGAGRGARNALYVTLLEGIGGGIVEQGRLLGGRDGSAGEIGHTRVSDDGPICGCGGRGCLEAHLAPARLAALWRGMSAEQAQRVALQGEAPDDAFSQMLVAARQGDAKARHVLHDAAIALARGLGNAVSLLNPERIILGGRFAASGDMLLDTLRRALDTYTLVEFARGIEIRAAELGADAAFCGMAAYVRDRLFAYPSVGATIDAQAALTEVA